MKTRIILYADDGMVLTNGVDFGRVIYLADGVEPSAFHEITHAEYDKLTEEQEEEE